MQCLIILSWKNGIHDYDDREFVRAEKTEDVVTNVIRVTELLQEYGLQLNNQRQTVKGVEIFPQMTFSPKVILPAKLRKIQLLW